MSNLILNYTAPGPHLSSLYPALTVSQLPYLLLTLVRLKTVLTLSLTPSKWHRFFDVSFRKFKASNILLPYVAHSLYKSVCFYTHLMPSALESHNDFN